MLFYGHHGLVIMTSTSQAEGLGSEFRVAQLLFGPEWPSPYGPSSPRGWIGESLLVWDGNSIERKTTGENNVLTQLRVITQSPIEDALRIDEAENVSLSVICKEE